ncbi:MAG: S9 family peptidase [Gammaproteobacteria bacterium]|nr:S9 family peptidase [Gammaproteobacteria bacterium]
MIQFSRLVCSAFLASLLLAACTSTPSPQPTAATADGVERRQVGNLIFEDIPPVSPDVEARLAQYLEVRSAGFQGWLPGGEALVSTRFGETVQIHRVARPGGAREQLTFFPEPVSGALASPDADHPGFLYLRDAGGSEFWQLYFFDLTHGRSVMLSDGSSRNSSPAWDRQGRQIAWSSTLRNGRDTDIWLRTLDGEARSVVTAGGTWFTHDFSASGERLLVARYVSRSDVQPHVVDLASGDLTPLLPEGMVANVTQLRFGPDDSIYFSSDLGGEFVRLYRLREPGAEPEAVTGAIDHDLERFEISPDGRFLAFSLNENTVSRLYVRRLRDNSFVALPELPVGIISGLDFSTDGDRLGFTLNTATSPGDVHSIDLRGRTLTRWTRSEVGGLDTANFVAPEHFMFPTFDTPDGRQAAAGEERRMIPAFVYRPTGPGPHPVVVQIHGGPEAQARPGFSPNHQFWVNELGFAVVVPNVRGSTGYGRSFHQLDNGKLREDSVRDIGALLDWIAEQPELDANAVATFGGSYGGYMVLASHMHFGDRLAAGVNVVGISNFVTFLENTQDYRRHLRREEYGDERDPAMRAHLEAISPLNNIERMTRPLLIVQGANDPRVPQSEADQLVAALRARGQPAPYLLALDEGHGFRKRSNRDAYLAVAAEFLQRHLVGD